MLRRELEAELTHKKIAIIGGMYANNSFEKSEEAKREEAIKDVEEQFAESMLIIWGDVDPEGEDINYEDDPFFSAAKRGMDKLDVPHAEPDDHITTGEVIEVHKEFESDQS